ncbi:MAG: hypothetical protein ABI867_31140 [Kofleriaceae bacterium]
MVRLIAIAVLLGCGHSTSGTTAQRGSAAASDAGADVVGLDQDLPRLAARGVKLYEEIAAAFEQAGDNCAAATAKLDALTRANADVVAANQRVLQEDRAMQLKLALRTHEDQFDKAAKSIMGSKTLPACSENAAFAKAYDQLVGAN